MRIGFVELLLILLIASLTIGPSAALWVDRWLRRANRASAAAARRRAVQEAQRAAEREEVLQRFQKLSIVFTLAAVAALVWALVLRPIEAPPKTYTAPDHRQASGAAQAELSTDRREIWDLGGYQGVDCIRTRDGLVYAAAWNGSSLKKRTSDLVRTDGGNAAVILSVEGELTGFAFDAAGDVWLTQLTTAGGTLCRAKHDSWGAAVEQVVTQLDGAPLGAVSAVEVSPAGKVICLAVGAAGGSAPKYLISAVLLLALGAVNFHGALKGGAEQELLRWTDERDRLVAMRSCQITLQVMNGLLFGGAMTALLCYAITRRALFQTVGITLCAVILTLFFVTMAANRYFERRM